MMTTLSIITVCLNAGRHIAATYQSLQNQLKTDYEWIVIDGGSSDNTVQFLHQCSNVTHLVSEPDKGIYDAMNKGIALSSGEYCLFLNAGDSLFTDDVFDTIRRDLVSDLVVGRIQLFWPDSGKTEIRRFDTQDVRKKYLYSRTLPHQATFIRRELFETFGNYDTGFSVLGDYDFFVRVMNGGASLSFSQVCVSNYRMDGISSQIKGTDKFQQELDFLRKKNFSLSYRFWRRCIDTVEGRLARFNGCQ